jgi:hypothetical protein
MTIHPASATFAGLSLSFNFIARPYCNTVERMRLPKLQTGHGIRQKFLLGLTTVLTFSEPFDVLKTFTYRPEYFGKHFCDLGHDLLRGPSEWTIGERELFGAFTASLNHCLF